ncbi:MAG TPA: hypothetical protein VEP50_17735 [bacterium]|nr:hypothetical protein [bacterium]
MDEEASGYFLVPPGKLPAGWRPVDDGEGARTWGRGDTGYSKDTMATGPDVIQAFPCGKPSNPTAPAGPSAGGCTDWNVEAMVVGLSLHDTPVGYTPPVGPDMHFRLWYSQRDALQPSTMNYTNFGSRWTTNWLSYLGAAGCNQSNGCGTDKITVYGRGGGGEQFQLSCTVITAPGESCAGIDTPFSPSAPGQYSQSILTYEGGEVDGGTFEAGAPEQAYTLQRPDGSIATYSQLTMGAVNYYMTQLSDPQGNTVQINWDPGTTRITSLQDAAGNPPMTLCYSDSSTSTGPCATAPQTPPCPNPPASGPPLNMYQVTRVVDPFGRVAYFQYDSMGRLTNITDVLCITSTYTYASDTTTCSPTSTSTLGCLPDDTVTSLATTPYGTTTFTYGVESLNTSLPWCAQTDRYVQITEPLGRTSRVESCQDPGNPASSEPNGDNPCVAGYVPPTGAMSCQDSVGPPLHSSFTNSNMQFRNTFIWNPVEYNEAVASAAGSNGVLTTTVGPPNSATPSLDYTKAKLIHWLHEGGPEGQINTTSRVPESTKEPLDNRLWFGYAGQGGGVGDTWFLPGLAELTIAARVLCSGSSCNTSSYEEWNYGYNSAGNLTSILDPVGRGRTFGYASNNIDLTSIMDNCGAANCGGCSCGVGGAPVDLLLAGYSYSPASTCSSDTSHQVFAVTGANGQTTSLCPQPNGQPGTITPPGGAAKIQYNYPTGSPYVQSITAQPPGSSPLTLYSFGPPDSFGRIDTVTDATGMTYTYTYDAADRVTEISFSDDTSIIYHYNSPVTNEPTLDLQSITDTSSGLTTTFTYDAQRVLTGISSANRQVEFAYAGDDPNYLQEVLDPRGYTTFYVRDLEGRLQDILYPSAPPVGPFEWDAAGRLTKDPDATYTYNVDGTVNTVTYANETTTPTVTYQYDPAYLRLTQVSSANAQMIYQYYPTSATLSSATPGAGLLESVTTTFANLPNVNYSTIPDTVTYAYDANNRVTSRTVDGVGESFSYDPLGRLYVDDSVLDYFVYSYSDATPRVSQIVAEVGGEGLTLLRDGAPEARAAGAAM